MKQLVPTGNLMWESLNPIEANKEGDESRNIVAIFQSVCRRLRTKSHASSSSALPDNDDVPSSLMYATVPLIMARTSDEKQTPGFSRNEEMAFWTALASFTRF